MEEYAIITDSGSDISPEELGKWGVERVDLTFRFEGEDRVYADREMAAAEFYDCLRKGKQARTSGANVGDFTSVFERKLQAGQDVLCLSFSSGLSATAASARAAAEELRGKYPKRRIITLDTLCGSAGLGLLVHLAVKRKNEGLRLAENAAFLSGIARSVCHWFTVDDLRHLRRGGRISPTTAVAGTVLGIKPIMHMDDEGHLVAAGRARGRKAAIAALAEKFRANAYPDTPVFLSHADSPEDASTLAELICEETGRPPEFITDIGAVIGAHSGPGTLALFFLGKKR